MTSETPLEAAERVWDEYDLRDRADEPFSGACVLLTDAAEALERASKKAFEQMAVTPDIVQIVHEAAKMATDALVLAAVDPRTPTAGVVEYDPETGYYIRRAARAAGSKKEQE
jgi:hypothetical protein